MTKSVRLGFIASLCLVSLSCATMSGTGGVKLPAYSDRTLKNGLKILMVKDHSLPYVSMGLLIRTGASSDPMGKSGLAELTADLLERGTKQKTAEQIADDFGQLGAGFGSSTEYDYSYLSTSGLSVQQQTLYNLFFQLTTEPLFSTDEVNRLKAERISEIKRAYDQPNYVASRLFGQLLFGAHPYGRSSSGTVRDIGAIRQKDIIRFYLKNYRPNNAMLVLVGDLDEKMVDELIVKLEAWESRPLEAEPNSTLPQLAGMQVQLADRTDLKQTEVRIGHYGVKRAIDEYQILGVAETILSGGFTSRLMKEIRVKRGLTYGIYSSFDAREEVGPFTIGANTRHEKVGELVSETIKTFSEFYEKGVTDREVSDAKGYLQGVFPRMLETPDSLARILISLRFYGVSDAYLTDYVRNLQKISASDVNRVIRKYYHPDRLRVLIYGPKDKIIEQLRPIGTVEVKSYKELL